MTKKQKVLIVGGGFGGVKAAHVLANHPDFEVTLLSDSEDLRYYPTLYLTATGRSRNSSAIPLASIFAGTSVKLVKGEAASLDRQTKTLSTKDGQTYSYDSLILALGVVTNYFGIPGLAEFSYSIKTTSEVSRFKAHVHKQLEDEHKPDLNYVIVGAGPTGIELAGALPAYLSHIIKSHGLPPKKVNVDLVEAMPRLLPNLPRRVSSKVRRQLNKLGVKLYVGSKVGGETADQLMLNNEPLASHTVVWTAGVTNHPFYGNNHFSLMGRGKVGVDVYLQAEPNIFVLGDNANTPYSGLAQTALHDGQYVAHNLIRAAKGKAFKSYKAIKPISVIPAGPNWAVVMWGKFTFSGYLGYLLREVADLRGLHDLEPWPKASKQFFSQFALEDDCKICTIAASKYSG